MLDAHISEAAVIWLRLQLWNAPASVCHYWVSILSPRGPSATHGDHDAISTARLFFPGKIPVWCGKKLWCTAVNPSKQEDQELTVTQLQS